MQIANPIYDVVFKYLMQNNEIAILEEAYPEEYRQVARWLNGAVSEPEKVARQ